MGVGKYIADKRKQYYNHHEEQLIICNKYEDGKSTVNTLLISIYLTETLTHVHSKLT